MQPKLSKSQVHNFLKFAEDQMTNTVSGRTKDAISSLKHGKRLAGDAANESRQHEAASAELMKQLLTVLDAQLKPSGWTKPLASLNSDTN